MFLNIVDRYTYKYGLELVGEDFGNFHVDVDLYGATSEIYVVESVFLGNNTYIDMLESTDKHGNTINSAYYNEGDTNTLYQILCRTT